MAVSPVFHLDKPTQLIISSFNSSRYPVKPSDTARKFDPAANNHVVFIRKNKFFEVQVIEDGKELSTSELETYVGQY